MSDALAPRLAFWALLPLLLPQALWVKARAPRFPPAPGERSGRIETGAGPALRFLALGDSVIDGVGAETLDGAVPVQAAHAVSERLQCPVHWQVIGQSGVDAGELRARLHELQPEAFDAILLSVGVNDVTGLHTARRYARDLSALFTALRAHSPRAVMLLAGIPPLHGFPLLPQPLRWLMGLRARRLDGVGRRSAESQGVLFAPLDFEPEPSFFAADGYHPGPQSHRDWGRNLGERLAAALRVRVA